MKTEEIQIGGVYSAKITDKVVPVRIDRENPRGGWNATNMVTNRAVRIKSARKLRDKVKGPGGDTGEENKAEVKSERKAEAPAKKTKATPAKKKTPTRAKKSTGGKAPGDSKKKATTKEKPPAKPKKLSLIDAAAQVLAKSKEPMNCKALVEQVMAEGLWTTTAPTPHATLYSAVLREIQTKGKDARFKKVDRGQFTLSNTAKKEG